MALEFIRETLSVIDLVNEDSAQTVIENDIIVPDVKPDMVKILLVDGEVSITECEASNDFVSVKGNIRYKILYISDQDDNSIKSINSNSQFSYDIGMQNARNGFIPQISCNIEHIEYDLLNSRKINIRTVLKTFCRLMSVKEKEIVSDLKGFDDIQVLRESISINNYLGSGNENFILSDNLEVPEGKPAIKEVLRNDVKILSKEFKVTDDKIAIKGDLIISTLYIGDDEKGSFQSMEHEVSFSKLVDLKGVDENSECDIEYRVLDYSFECDEDSDGELRILNSEINVEVSVFGYEKRNIQMVLDTYSRQAIIDLQKESFQIDENHSENRVQIVLKDTIVLDDNNPEIGEIYAVLCKPILNEYFVNDDRVTLEGLVNCNVLYLSDNEDQTVYCINQEIPFTHNMDVKGVRNGVNCNIDIDIDHYNYSVISSNEIEIRLAIGAGFNGKTIKSIMVPVSASERSFDEMNEKSSPSLIIYYSKPGDTLWQIAKRYFTTIEEIRKYNDINEKDLLGTHQKIIIPKKIV